ncbi:MAG: L-2-amino-thiazoline-4-carboxylic acid hydrolase [Candidatus Lokiarchaeota archaeon]|nr:L-2-amino-thiazoline-4-carboxylic acid hydrolase [Candidatus Lokiarchaeota archaeon]
MSVKAIEDYYIKRKAKLLKDFDSMLPLLRELLAKNFNNDKIDELFNLMKQEYEDLIPEIPYIGGKKNFFTNFLIGSASILAIIYIIEKEGFTLREIGEFLYELSDVNHQVRKKMMENTGKDPSKYPFEKEYMDYMKLATEKSQKRKYPADWVADYVEGDGKEFEWGFNVYECGIHKFFKRLDAEKYVPLICLFDFSEANIFGFGFSRTQTLSNGAPLCDHRYIKNVQTPRAWPPDKVQEFKTKL